MKTIIKRRVTEFFKSAMFCVIMGLSDNFTVRAPKCRSYLVSTIGVAVNDDSEACDNILKTNHVMSRNLVK